jgi:hypothetical protein
MQCNGNAKYNCISVLFMCILFGVLSEYVMFSKYMSIEIDICSLKWMCFLKFHDEVHHAVSEIDRK